MKKLFLAFCITANICTVIAKESITTNNVEYTKIGSMGTKDKVVTDVVMANIIKKGETFIEAREEEEDYTVFDYINSHTNHNSASVSHTSDDLFEVNRTGLMVLHKNKKSLASLNEDGNYFSKPFSWYYLGADTNSMRKIELPNTNAVTTTITQNSNQLFADRKWVIEILKAYRDGKLTINDDDTITISE